MGESKKNGGGEKMNNGKIVQKKEGEGAKVNVFLKDCIVIGKVDPRLLRGIVQMKIHKHPELISSVPKKDDKGKGDAGAREGKKKQEKEPPITTAMLKVHLPCQECIQDFQNIVTKFKAYKKMEIYKEKHLGTVTGSMNNMKDLAAKLKKHLNKKAEIVPLKKEGGDKKEKAKGNGEGKGKVKA